MAIRHTPGPWELDSAKDGDGRYQIINGQLPKGINGDFGYSVADTMNRHHCISPEEDEANAKLIAAAPEMAELLLRAFTHVTHGRPHLSEVENVLRKAGVM